jgi:uncharacterized protein (DUF2237 family)
MKDIFITLIFFMFLFIIMPPRKTRKKEKKKKRKSKKKKRKSKKNSNLQKNIYNESLKPCSMNPLTGYHRSGYCFTDDMDQGTHTVCAQVNDDFLEYTMNRGNDLSTKNDEYNFPGLKDGDKWCLCALRWSQALKAGKAPPLDLESTNLKTLEYIDLDTLENNKI